MTTTTTTTAASASRPAIPDDELTALVLGTALPIPGSLSDRAISMLAEVLDCEPTADALRSALTYPGARSALVAAVSLCQHGRTFDLAATDEGDGTIMASFLSLAIATARLVRAEDDAVDTAGRPDRDGEPWREYVERCGRIAMVRSLRAVYRPDAGPTSADAMYRTPRADDPSVTAPRAPKVSRSPGAKVPNVPRSRSERTRNALARGAAVVADALGAGPDTPDGLPRLIGTPDACWPHSVVGDPACPLAGTPGEDGAPHACTSRCWPLGGFHTYSPRQGRAHATLPCGVLGPVLTRDSDECVIWHAFQAFPVGVAVQRSHGDTDTDARLPDKVKTRLAWRPSRARQSLTSDGKRFTPRTFVRDRGTETRLPVRTAQHLAAGGTFDQAVVTTYGGRTFVGHVLRRETVAPSHQPDRQRATKRAVRALTPQQRAVISLIVDAAVLTMFDGAPRTAHRDDQGTGYVITRTTDGVLSLLTPAGITTPLPTDPRRMTTAVRLAITTP